MSIKNYIEGDINDISLIINSNKINTSALNVDGDLKLKSQNGDIVNYKTPQKGINGTQLTIDANGNTYWGSSGGTGGVSNPMSMNLDCNNFDIINSNNINSITNKTNTLNVDNINPNVSSNITMSGSQLILYGNIKTFIESGSDVELECNLGSNIRMTNDLTLQGQNISINSNSSLIDMNNGKLLNVDDIDGYVKYKIISAGSDIGFNGRVRIETQTFSITPLLLFRRIYTDGCSIYDGSFMSYNPTQNKIWRTPALCVVEGLVIDKAIGGYGISAIGGTNRASTIDFTINAGYLECWITANFTDPTINVYECSIWSDTTF